MKSFNLLIQSVFILLSPLYLFSQSEYEFPFPDNEFLEINEKINQYQDYDYDLTKEYTLELLKRSKICEEDEITLLGYTALEYYAYIYNKKDDFEAFTNEADSIFNLIISPQNLSTYADYYFDHINFYSIFLFRKNKIVEADTLISNSINLLENNSFDYGTKNYYLTAFYQNLSSCKELQWNFSDGILLLNKIKNLKDKSYISTGFINQNLSSYHEKIGNYYEALNYAKSSYKNYENRYKVKPTNQNLTFLSLSLIKIVHIYILLEDPKTASFYLNKITPNAIEKDPLIEARFYESFAQINLLENQQTLALNNYKKCLRIQQEKLPNRTLDQAEVYQSIAQIYHQQNQVDSSFHYLQKAVVLLTNNPNLKDLETNPNQFQGVTYKQTLMDVLYSKSELALKKYSKSQDFCDLLIAKQSNESAQNLADKIRLELSSNSDKELFSKKGHKIYEQALQIASLLEKYEHLQANLDFAYRAMESSRALILAEAVYQSKTREFAGIPPRFISREEKFREQIIEVERQIFQLDQEGEDAEAYKEKKWILQADFAEFTDTLKTLHPDYYNLKYAVSAPSIQTLQTDLKVNNQALIEYFLTYDKIYALIVSEDRYELKTWDRPQQLTHKIQTLRRTIYEDANYSERAELFVKSAHNLYKDLILPLGDLPDRLTIIPDGVLNYLPFDVLLTDKADYPGNYKTHDYLLRTKQISYDYSATLRMQERKTTTGKVDFMGFAPYYEDEDEKAIASRGVSQLKHNITEVTKIKQLIGGVAYLKEEAVKLTFKNECHKAGILHFAGHAIQEEINPDFSHLLFSSGIKNNRVSQLAVKEIYAHKMPAKMVVLSACNTGMGEVQKGEGMYSLGRAFSYAGAHSLISTLWSVDDKSTMQIMESFYKHLKEGKTKDEALQAAKIFHIEKALTNKKSQPLFWAGFVAYGDMTPMEFGSSWLDWFDW